MMTTNPTRRMAQPQATGPMSRTMERIHRYRVYRNTLRELSDMSDRELLDLGLSRGMLRRVAYEAAYC